MSRKSQPSQKWRRCAYCGRYCGWLSEAKYEYCGWCRVIHKYDWMKKAFRKIGLPPRIKAKLKKWSKK